MFQSFVNRDKALKNLEMLIESASNKDSEDTGSFLAATEGKDEAADLSTILRWCIPVLIVLLIISLHLTYSTYLIMIKA